jgi:hypothetical protein
VASTFSFMTMEEWITANPKMLKGLVDCEECDGSGEHECECGDVHECHACDGSGFQEGSSPIDKYIAQLDTDTGLIKRYYGESVHALIDETKKKLVAQARHWKPKK